MVIEDSAGSVSKTTVNDISDDGVIIRLGAEITFRNCRISDCGHRGLYVYQSGKPTLEACEIAATGAEGVAVAHQSMPILRRCHIHDTQGVGVSFAATTSGELNGCKIENTAEPRVLIADGARVEVVEGTAAAGVGATSDSRGDAAKVESLLADLDAMVGLASVKAEVRAIIDEIQVNEWRRSAGLNVGGVSNHLIFAGAPGTGKTTVSRIYGQLLAALGVLSGRPLREVSRRDLVGQYVGHTTEKTATVFDETRGGVVFLDEAYTLSRQAGAGNDFGQEAIDTIVKMMEDMRSEIAVIAAGYTREMRDFLDANPGLASRFVKTIEFENYSAEELTLIVSRMVDSGDYTLQPESHPLLIRHFGVISRDPNFGNARDARKLFESLRKIQSQRLRQLGRTPSLDELRELTVADVGAVVASSG
jgi:Holliday junction resolvasome RuvABC ATP-dependent DNA helicase subunit